MLVKIFFREITIHGKERLPSEGAVIFTPNHPNGLVDPLLLFFLSPPFDIRFVAKAPLFKIPLLGSILRSLHSIPVVRRFEAGGQVDYNAFFESCVAALKNGESIAIFPEGVSLPQSYLAPLKTGPARLFFLASAKNIPVRIIPIGLNYEQGPVFRSSVLITIAEPLDTTKFKEQHKTAPSDAIRSLTDTLANALAQNVLQAETYRDKELMILLEQLSSERQDQAWHDRFFRLKAFEQGLNKLRATCGPQIDRLRNLLVRYRSLSHRFDVSGAQDEQDVRPDWFRFVSGWIFAIPGWLCNFIPYYFVDLLVRIAHHDESAAATYKIVYSIFVFPIFYLVEAILIGKLWGLAAGLVFSAAIIPLSTFTLQFFEWREKTIGQRSGRNLRAAKQLDLLRERILKELNSLSNRRELIEPS